MIVARSDYPVDAGLAEKIAQFCDVEKRAVVPMVTTEVLYEVPLLLEEKHVAEYILEKLKLSPPPCAGLERMAALVAEVRRPRPSIKLP